MMVTKNPAHQALRYGERLNTMKAVRQKIMKVYGFAEEDIVPNATLTDSFSNGIAALISSHKWEKRRNDCIQFSGLDNNLAPKLDDAATKALVLYTQAFYLRRKISDAYGISSPAVQPEYEKTFKNPLAGNDIAEIYINHATNAAYKMFHSLGLSDRSALSINGFLISNVRSIYSIAANATRSDADVYPMVVGTGHTPQETSRKLSLIADYWAEVRDQLQFKHNQSL